MKLEGRIAIVTGAAGGMGGDITRRLVREGATVTCLDKADPQARVDELNAQRADNAHGVIADVATSKRSSGSWMTWSSGTDGST